MKMNVKKYSNNPKEGKKGKTVNQQKNFIAT